MDYALSKFLPYLLNLIHEEAKPLSSASMIHIGCSEHEFTPRAAVQNRDG
jgi:hypothetical protein